MSVPTKVALPPETTVRLLPALILPVTACELEAFSTPRPKPAVCLAVSDLVCLLSSWFSFFSVSLPMSTLTDKELEVDSLRASLNVTLPPAANCASPPASTLAPSMVMLPPEEMFKDPPVLMLETTASELFSDLISTPAFKLAALLSLSIPTATLTDKLSDCDVLRAASIETLPPAATLVSPATLICVPSSRVSPRVVMFKPPPEFSDPTTALVPELLAVFTSALKLALASMLAPAKAVASNLMDAATSMARLLDSNVSLAALKSKLSAAMLMPPSPAVRLVPSSVVLPVVLMLILPPAMLAATAEVEFASSNLPV